MRGRSVLVAAVLIATVAAGCVASASTEPHEPAGPTAEPVFQPVPLVEATATEPTTLSVVEVGAALRDLVCWYTDPDLARTCLPPGEEFVTVLQRVARSGDERFVAPLVDMLWMELGWERWVREALEALTGQRHATAAGWYAWVAEAAPPLPPQYAEWKGNLLALVDPLFARLIRERGASGPGPEELVWGLVGVAQVPPLVSPDTVHRVEERYLSRSDVVFGVVFDGVAMAYPERIVAWHGVVSDTVSGVPVQLWHCPSCGGAAVFGGRASDGQTYTFAAAGLVWESRRLVFDDETGSLWDTVTGVAVSGPAAGARLTLLPAVRTTWGEWSDRYRNTRVLSLDTGFVRDYAEGVAIAADLASEGPLFPAPVPDDRLPVKARVVGVSAGGAHRAYLLDRVEAVGLLHDTLGGRSILLYSPGPGRGVTVYDSGATTFERVEGPAEDREIVDTEGLRWFMDDERLLNTRNSRTHNAIASQTLYWFAWAGAHPDTGVWE